MVDRLSKRGVGCLVSSAPAGCHRNPSGVFMAVLPRQIGPCQLVELGALVAIRCPSDLTGSCVGQVRRGSLEVGDGSCRPRVPPRWSRSSAAAPIRCSGGQVSIWTTNRAGSGHPQRAAPVGPMAYWVPLALLARIDFNSRLAQRTSRSSWRGT